ncbi:hypothetical protein CMU20_14705 [Elizabethkingia anophelis]|nr:hypothetical protein [Elizabethkingia anophelis]
MEQTASHPQLYISYSYKKKNVSAKKTEFNLIIFSAKTHRFHYFRSLRICIFFTKIQFLIIYGIFMMLYE